MSEWQPIETAPKDGTMILVCWAGSGMHPIVSRWLLRSMAWTHPFNKPVNPPTHWMPLPEPPKISVLPDSPRVPHDLDSSP